MIMQNDLLQSIQELVAKKRSEPNPNFEMAKKQTIKKLKELNLTHALEFHHYGSRVTFYTPDGMIFLATSGNLILYPEVYKENHEHANVYYKLLKCSKRIN